MFLICALPQATGQIDPLPSETYRQSFGKTVHRRGLEPLDGEQSLLVTCGSGLIHKPTVEFLLAGRSPPIMSAVMTHPASVRRESFSNQS